MADKDEDVDRAIGALAESAPSSDPPEPPGKSPNTRSSEPKILRPAQKKNIGIGAEPAADMDDPNGKMPYDNAFDTANEIKRRFDKFPSLGDIHGIIADVFPCDGTPYRSLGAIPFTDLIDPTMSPGDKLQQLVLERVHRKYAHTEKTYDVGFRGRTSGAWITRNKKLYFGSPQEIDRLSGVGEPPREMPPPPPYRQPVSPYATQPGYGQAPPQQQPQPSSRNPEVDALTHRLAQAEGAIGEVLGFLREERAALRAQAGLPPAAPAAPAPAPQVPAPGVGGGIEDMVARGVVAAFKSLGVNPQAPPTSPNTPPAKDPLVGELESMATTIVREALGGVGKIIREQVRGGLAGVGATPPDPEPIEPPDPEPAEPIPPPPFHVSQVGSQWPDGRPVMYAQDAEGNMDLKGVAFSNPIIIEQGLRIADKFADGFKDMMSKVTLPNGNQVVGKTPKDAVDANPRGSSPQNGAAGVGEAPKSPNNPSHGGSQTSSGGGFPEG
jgi:hypothetical protein